MTEDASTADEVVAELASTAAEAVAEIASTADEAVAEIASARRTRSWPRTHPLVVSTADEAMAT